MHLSDMAMHVKHGIQGRTEAESLQDSEAALTTAELDTLR